MKRHGRTFFAGTVPALLLVLTACSGSSGSGSDSSGNATPATETTLTSTVLTNSSAYVPAQCYTKTLDDAGAAHNPCFNCHIPSTPPNYVNDGVLQVSYDFHDPALTNAWSNLFKDRTAQVAAIGDAAMIAYVRQSNYFDGSGGLQLAKALAHVPAGWDYNHDGAWNGYVPDCYFNFDDEGFDRTPDGGYSGWRAYAYYPFLGTFWPTNGSTDDAMIRLPAAFRQNTAGEFDLEVYKANLAIVEALIKRADVAVDPIDEARVGVDLDHDGVMGTASVVVYDWAPGEGRMMYYAGAARALQESGALHLAGGLYPEGTEFLHSVRYLDVDTDAGIVGMAAHMKELRYARKTGWLTYSDLQEQALEDIRDKEKNPERVRTVFGDIEHGVSNGQRWTYQGFIEAADGTLRPQTYEESVYCVGCHSGIGATTDGTFSFPRKLGAAQYRRGWYHWSQKGLKNLAEPVRRDGHPEYAYYLERNGAGDEFRGNDEVQAKFFNPDGSLKADALATLSGDVSYLLFPSVERALTLDKAYKVIVDEQSFKHGRDGHVAPVANAHQQVQSRQPTGIDVIEAGPGQM
jgi:hypothetical protein